MATPTSPRWARSWGVALRDPHQLVEHVRDAARSIPCLARAFAAVKQFAAAYTEGGVAAADERLLEDAVGLFDTEDAQNAIESFLTSGPGKATFAGR